jgi:bifunctional N-acetylglucosamine-1-phosphate-uridyltransferase/glucosamine-1-phosphate-acetyltransferase GlmU-like protein
MKETYIILAGGVEVRWKVASSKMLVPILGQPLIRRTCSLFKKINNISFVVYSNNKEIIGEEIGFWPKSNSLEILEAITKTSPLWKGVTTILLGDVIFSNKAIEWIATTCPKNETPIQLFGKTGSNPYTQKPWAEIYGLRLLEDAKNVLLNCIDKTLQTHKKKKKIWDLYSVLLGMPVATKPVLKYPKSKIFVEILDWSDDIDTCEEYYNMLRLLSYLHDNPFLNANYMREILNKQRNPTN